LFPERSIRGTLQCAGNRRAELTADQAIVGEILWDANGIGTAEWTGFRLIDVLQHVGIPDHAQHVVLMGGDTVRRAEGEMSFERSIALGTVRECGERILHAHSMNGAPLTPHHGFPLRAVAPEVIGASSVKWLERITLQAEPSANPFQAVSYRQDPVARDGSSGPMLEYLPINSAITRYQVAGSRLHLWGYAVPGKAARILDVHVSVDAGPWERAELTSQVGIGQWTQWKAERELLPGRHVVTVRAVDSNGKEERFQDDHIVPRNRRGYLNNELPRITVAIA
jgi:sulfite oxidase